MKLTYAEIIDVLKGTVIIKDRELNLKGVETDTRRLCRDSVFFALKGARVNGNDLLEEAVENGAVLCIVDEIKDYYNEIKGCTIIKVENSRNALCELASYYIKKFDVKVVGITGSTGKTSTKDILSAALSVKYEVFKTIGNYNSDVGLPLMIFKLNKKHDIAVLEMGMSGFGEIELLANIAKPDYAIITNIGTSHLEQLKTRDNILKAKLEIANCFGKDNILVINGDDDKLAGVTSNAFSVKKCGLSTECVISAEILKSDCESVSFEVLGERYDQQRFDLNMPGKHNVSNMLLCLGICEELDVSYDEIKAGIMNIEKTSMRLDVKVDESGFVIVNDTYNASPDSMKAAIDVMKNYKDRTKVCVLGTMKELGEESDIYHKEVGRYAKENEIDAIYVTGEFGECYVAGFGEGEAYLFKDKKSLVQALKGELTKKHTILVKASRSMKFETISDELLKKINKQERE